MKCQDVKLELTAFLGNELTSDKNAVINEHLANCPDCAAELERLQAAEQILKDGLNSAEQAGEASSLGNWVVARAASLSEDDIQEKKEWVADLFTEDSKDKKQAPARNGIFFSRRVKALVSVAVLAALMFVYWPNIIRVSANVPILGEWVEQLVLKDAGLAWAYDNGYMSDERVSVEADGVRLTVLGTVADPVMTTVVYLVEGWDAEGAGAHISAVNGEGSFSWHDSPVDTPLGKVGMAHTDSLPEGENSVTLQLRSGGKLKNDLQANVTVDREEISRISREYPLEYRQTMEGVSVEAHKIVYTPTQVLVEYTVAGGGSLGGIVRDDEHIYLLDYKGNQINSSFRKGEMIDEDVWLSYAVFERPGDTEDLKMVVPVLGRRELVDVEFTPDSVGVRQELDSGLQLVDWRTNGDVWNADDILELKFQFKGEVRAFSGWSAVDADGNTHELDRPRWGMTGTEEVYGFSLDSFEPVKVLVSEAQVVVRGDWEIPLPGAE